MSAAQPPIRATRRDLVRAVLHRDDAPGEMLMQHAETLVGLTALQLGLAALGRGVAVDLGNGYVLICTTVRASEVPA